MKPQNLVYLDHAATTPVDKEVAAAMAGCLASAYGFANPASNHPAGRLSAEVAEHSRAQVGALLGAAARDIVFTSGATESNNLAILGGARHRAPRGKHLITMTTEHKSVTECFEALQREGFEVSWLNPDEAGLLDPRDLDAAIRDDTQLVSIMHVNNETGVIQDIATIASICRRRDVLYHCDAAQSAGKLPVDVNALGIDLLSISAHKFYGPQGIGALFMADRPGCQIEPQVFGGSQERRVRPGTHAMHQVLGLGLAAEMAGTRQAADALHFRKLRERLWQGIGDLPGLLRNGTEDRTFAGILNVSVPDVDGESLLLALEPLCVASGSACNSQSGESSPVLRAMGRRDSQAQGAIRFSFGRDTTNAHIDAAIERFRWAVDHLDRLRPGVAARAMRA